ncbi:MAG TPA: long-chain fatty acid--CoA ligase [Solirubrobacter sp.]|nr:long-chain fatty acid--CoA ligase [Solirubrobacter sp.]
MSNLAEILVTTAERAGDRPALRLGDTTTTYRMLDDASARVAGLLAAKGLKPGDRVGLMLPNVPQFAYAYYGTLRAGGVVVPMNILLKSREVAYYLGDPEAKLLLVWHQYADEAQAGAEEAGAEVIVVGPEDFEDGAIASANVVFRRGDDLAQILYTSGTTGTPKGAMITHDNLRLTCEHVGAVPKITEDDVTLGVLPLFHSFGQTVMLNAGVRVGACLTLLPRFTPADALETIERQGVTIFAGVPTMFHALLHHPKRDQFDTSSLRLAISGGSSIPLEVLNAFEQEFACDIIEGYGLSETAAAGAFNPPGASKAGSIGTALAGTEMKLVDDKGDEVAPGAVGEIVMRGYHIMKGYWKREDATREVLSDDGWFSTGDMATVDEDGYYFIVDRKKDLIIRGGYNVYPREIEEVLYEHPAVSQAAVVGIPDAAMGEEVGAAIVLKAGAEINPAEMIQFVKARIAAYKYPRKVWFTPSLPLGPTGKILKREIKVPEELSV